MTILQYSDVVSVAPTNEPVTVAMARRNSDVDDSYRDVDFARWIVEARKQVEHDSRLSLVNQTWVKSLDSFPGTNRIELRSPLVSVTSIAYIDTSGSTQTFSSANYEVDTARDAVWLAYSQSWPSTRGIQNSVTITYVSGHGATASSVPEAAKTAILLLVKHRYENPEIGSDAFTGLTTYTAVIDQLRGCDYP